MWLFELGIKRHSRASKLFDQVFQLPIWQYYTRMKKVLFITYQTNICWSFFFDGNFYSHFLKNSGTWKEGTASSYYVSKAYIIRWQMGFWIDPLKKIYWIFPSEKADDQDQSLLFSPWIYNSYIDPAHLKKSS